MNFFDNLTSRVSTFHNAFNIHAVILDESGNSIASYGFACKYCELFAERTGKYCPCRSSHQGSGELAARLDDCYIYTCPAGLYHLSVAILENANYHGSVLAGPILLDYPDIFVVDETLQKYNIPINDRPQLFSSMQEIPLVEPKRARYIGKLLFQLVENLLYGELTDVNLQREKDALLKKVSDYLQVVDSPDTPYVYHFPHEDVLVAFMRDGNVEGAQKMLNGIIGDICFTSGNNLEIIKVRMTELMEMLSHAAVSGGGNPEEAFNIVNEFQHKSVSTSNLTDLSFILLGTLKNFMNMIFYNIGSNQPELIKKAIIYMNNNFQGEITLNETARHLFISPSYFSTLFKKETNTTFSAYITELRIKHAKHLLAETALPLVDVAITAGFDSQQYFSAVFKKVTGLTPGKFRRSNRQ
jgi:AraC-like DNA-binding protein/ligand-binding sensor protein